MAGYVSNSGMQGGGTNTGQSYSFATGSETNSCVIVAILFGDSQAAVSGVTIGGVAAQLIGSVPSPISSAYGIEVWRLTGVTGTVNVVTTVGSCENWSIAILANNVDQTNPVRDFDTNNAVIDSTGTFSAPAVDSAVNDLVLAFCTGNSVTLTTNQTSIVEDSTSDFHAAARAAGASPNVTMSYAYSALPSAEAAIFALSLRSPSGGTVNTQTLSSTTVLTDGVLSTALFNRLTSEAIIVSEGNTERYIDRFLDAISEISLSDEAVLWLRRTRLLQDDIQITDALISQVIGYLIFTSVLTSNVTITDEALKTAYFYRLMESNVVTADQIMRALLVARDLLDGIEVADSGLTAVQRFILLTDAISLEDALTALYVPVTGPAVDNPIIRIGFDQPKIDLGGYGVN